MTKPLPFGAMVLRDVAPDVAHGLTNPAIAFKFGLALRTVKLYRQNVLIKLGADTTAELGSPG